MFKELTERVEIGGASFNVIVATKYGSTIQSCSSDQIKFNTPLLKSGTEKIRTRETTRENKQSNKRKVQ